MKKNIFLFLFLSAIFLSCKSSNSKELIVNKWKITDLNAPNMAVPDSIKDALKKSILEFTKDGRFLVTGMGTDDQSGTYSLSDDGKKLITVTKGRTVTNEINELTTSKIILTDTRNGSRLTAIAK